MTINKFQGKTKEEAIEKAKASLGPSAVVLNVKEVKPKGFKSLFTSKVTYEVTAAIEEKDSYQHLTANATETKTPSTEKINLAADEKIELPKPVRTSAEEEMKLESLLRPSLIREGLIKEEPVQPEAKTETQPEVNQKPNTEMHSELKRAEHAMAAGQRVSDQMVRTEQHFKERLDNLSELLEQKLTAVAPTTAQHENAVGELSFIRMIYNTLLRNGVDERYVNQILDEVEKFIRPGNNVDLILPNIYQKLILKFGQPKAIELKGKKPNVVFFVGPTGVGKTTTIAKIASKYKVDFGGKVAFATADTYRIAATEQLRVYANILDAPMTIVYSVDEINDAIEKYLDYDLIFVDTAGFSHKNVQQKNDVKQLLNGVKEEYRKDVYLVLSATTKYEDLKEIVDMYKEITEFKLIFTKVDETSSYGNLLNIKLYADADLSYAAIGQNVPDDIEVFDTQKIVKQLLGGK